MLSQVTGFIRYFRVRLGSDEGATMVEYGIMVALIAVSIIVIGLLGVEVFGAFNTAQNEIGPGPGPLPPVPPPLPVP